ncbi:AQJ64_40280 family protein [Streptomyces halstedii]|uniref:AQJ64_40280 family protein n=1 Tax=Streptomyces halstedii TaxID=1944 RepID=UPI003804FD5F
MTPFTTAVTWIDVRDRLPRNGIPVAAAITGRYPAGNSDSDTAPGEEFWLVRTMYYTTEHRDGENDATVARNCFVDSDRVIRYPYSPNRDDSVTHWAYLPTLPGQTTHSLGGDEVRPALLDVWRSPTSS